MSPGRVLCLFVPASKACSEYHYLLLYADKLVALNQVSGKVAAEVNWGPGSHAAANLIGRQAALQLAVQLCTSSIEMLQLLLTMHCMHECRVIHFSAAYGTR